MTVVYSKTVETVFNKFLANVNEKARYYHFMFLLTFP